MDRNGQRMWMLAVALAAAGAIIGALAGGPMIWLHYLCKPLATVLILSFAARAVPGHSRRYRIAVVLGLVCSLAGDVFLMLPRDLFLAGLVSFLLAHLCFLVAFFPGARWPERGVALAVFGAIAAVNLAFLLPLVPQPLQVAVLAYVAVLVAMAAFAAARAWALRADPVLARPAVIAAWGGALFILSDSLLAWNRFGQGLPLAQLLVLTSYFAAIGCIARSVAASGAPARG